MVRTLTYSRLGALADMLLDAAKLREDSYDRQAGFYNLTITDACRLASRHEDFVQVGVIMLTAAWKDSLAWAEKNQLKRYCAQNRRGVPIKEQGYKREMQRGPNGRLIVKRKYRS